MSGGPTPDPPQPGGQADGRSGEPPDLAHPTLRPPRPRAVPFGALRHRNFQLYFGGFVVSLVGVWMQRIAQSWLVLELTDSAFYVGLVDAMGSLPVLFFSLYAGAIADRVSKRRLVLTSQSSSMVFAFALGAIVLAGHVSLWHVVLVAALLGLANAFDIPARQAFMVELVGKDDLMSAIALNSSAFNGSRLVGPAVAGILIGLVGVGPVFVLNGVTYLAVIAALLAMRLPPAPRPGSISAWDTIRDGFRYVRTDRRVQALIANVAVVSVFAFPVQVLLPVVVRDVMGLGAVEYGWTMSAVGLGALLGALALATFVRHIPKGLVLGISSTAFGILVALFALTRSLAAALILLPVMGVAMIVTTALTNTLLQVLAPDELRGRVISFYTFAFVGLGPFGALQAGALAERFGPTVPLVAGGAVTALVGLFGVLRSKELRGSE